MTFCFAEEKMVLGLNKKVLGLNKRPFLGNMLAGQSGLIPNSMA